MSVFAPIVTLVKRGAPTGVDADGNDTFTPKTKKVQSRAFDPGASTEILGSQDTVTTQPRVFLPKGTSLEAIDALIIEGITYEVDGTPSSYRNSFTGWRPGPVVQLRAVSG